MEQDFTKGLSVCIGNYGYYNEGYLHDTWITLPKTEAEIRDFLHLNHLQDPLHEEIYISDYDGIPFGATQLFTEFCQLEDLNLLAKQLVTVSPSDLEKVGAWIQAQQLIRFDSISIHHRTSPERQEAPFTLFACLKLSSITAKSPISLFFFVRFYHLSSKNGHP